MYKVQIPTTSTKINIPKYIEIGKLIGREGCNLKPIEEETGTRIKVNTDTKPAHIEIKINEKITLLSCKDRVKEASNKLNNLMKTISEKEKKKKGGHNYSGKKDNHYAKTRSWKEKDLKKERITSERR
ncbi:hypothetical protein RclHR1_05790001 [Rhizophagus clarus]|uniref:K Homology domain-containing protein n=1 Tax=Rhizophagus clarus TaxID=94130 RepID=A0A2Z6S640_9GLOM|nr:hypothetical protein RclHR1_05790001 [Rhizophagus clarus]GES79525.1 hypothetical protein GLOIN_2v1556640 [Rhizophagus clarus]